jgi:NitT/TauT family transport system permease protein
MSSTIDVQGSEHAAATGSPPRVDPLEAGTNVAAAARRRRIGIAALIWGVRAVLIAVVLGVWQLCADEKWLNPVFTGRPSGIWTEFVHLFSTSVVTTDLWTTIYETLVGFAISVVLGIAAGLLLGRYAILERIMHPILAAMNSIPRIALAPLMILWFGLGKTSKVWLVVSFVFFVILSNTLAAVTTSDRDRMLVARSLGASERQRMWFFVLPGAVPVLAAALELGLIYSFMGAIIGEMLGGANGLGVVLTLDANQFDTNGYFAVLLLIVIVTVVLVQLLRRLRERMFAWQAVEMRGEHGFADEG